MRLISISDDKKVITWDIYNNIYYLGKEIIVGKINYLNVIDFWFYKYNKVLRVPNNIYLAQILFNPLLEFIFTNKIVGVTGYIGLILSMIFNKEVLYFNIDDDFIDGVYNGLEGVNGIDILSIPHVYNGIESKSWVTDITEDNYKKVREYKNSINYISGDYKKLFIKNESSKKNKLITNMDLLFGNILYDIKVFEKVK